MSILGTFNMVSWNIFIAVSGLAFVHLRQFITNINLILTAISYNNLIVDSYPCIIQGNFIVHIIFLLKFRLFQLRLKYSQKRITLNFTKFAFELRIN